MDNPASDVSRRLQKKLTGVLGSFAWLRAVCLNVKSREERVVYKKVELNGNVDSENNHGGSSRNCDARHTAARPAPKKEL
jgi:hypothetical protein